MTVDEQIALIQRLKSMGAKRAKVGDLDVEFSEENGDVVMALEQGIEQGRAEILRHLNDEQRAHVSQKIEDTLNYGE